MFNPWCLGHGDIDISILIFWNVSSCDAVKFKQWISQWPQHPGIRKLTFHSIPKVDKHVLGAWYHASNSITRWDIPKYQIWDIDIIMTRAPRIETGGPIRFLESVYGCMTRFHASNSITGWKYQNITFWYIDDITMNPASGIKTHLPLRFPVHKHGCEPVPMPPNPL